MKDKEKPRMEKAEHGGDWGQFWTFFRRVNLSWRWIIFALVVGIIYYAAVSLVPGNTAALYSGDFSMSAIMGLVINYLCTLVLLLATSVTQLLAESKSVCSVRNSVWERMIGVKTSYYDDNDPNSLLSAVTSDTEATVTTLISVIISIPSLVLYLAMCLMQVSSYNTKLLAVLFVLVPVYIIYAVLMGRWQYRTGHTIQMRIGGLTGFLSERIRNLPLIKSFATEEKETEQGIQTSKELYKANVQYQYINGVLGAYIFVTEAVGIVAAVLWGSRLLRQGEIDLEAWLAFFLFVPMINTVLRQLSMMWGNIKELQGRASRISAIMDAPQEQLNENASGEIPQGDIIFQNVEFGYGEKKALYDINLTIPQGKATAIVGPSGSGKTTLLKLLEQLYTPDTGTVSVGNTSLDQVNLRAWRSRVSYVTQDAMLFGGTVRESLTYGVSRAVTDEELKQATTLAGIYNFIMKQPDGFETQLSLWGDAMSGGQRQRLVIARELLKDADILLLDEPTSALDAETAAEVSDTIFARFAGKTIVTVSHELNFIAGSDQIIVLNQGKIEGSGSHDMLMESCPLYRSLVEEQSYQEVFAQ